jgi:hypothetical protein
VERHDTFVGRSSLPQIHARVTRTRTAVGSTILASGDLAPALETPISLSSVPCKVRSHLIKRNNPDFRRFDDAHGGIAAGSHDPEICDNRQGHLSASYEQRTDPGAVLVPFKTS